MKSHHHLKVCIYGTSPRGTCRWAWSQSDLRALEMGIFHCYVSLPEGVWKGVTSSRSWIDVEKTGDSSSDHHPDEECEDEQWQPFELTCWHCYLVVDMDIRTWMISRTPVFQLNRVHNFCISNREFIPAKWVAFIIFMAFMSCILMQHQESLNIQWKVNSMISCSLSVIEAFNLPSIYYDMCRRVDQLPMFGDGPPFMTDILMMGI